MHFYERLLIFRRYFVYGYNILYTCYILFVAKCWYEDKWSEFSTKLPF